jgi:hypothetical protein
MAHQIGIPTSLVIQKDADRHLLHTNPQSNMSSPNIQNMITNHTLAVNIITSHNTPNPLLNENQFSLLQGFSLDPTSIKLESSRIVDSSALTPSNLGNFIIVSSNTLTPALVPSELILLQSFFKGGEIDLSNNAGAGPMLRSHTLAYNLILRPHEIFDDESQGFEILRKFCLDPTKKDDVLREYGMLDEPSEEPGTRAQAARGSLAGYCVATYGTEKSAFDVQEMELLRMWFEKGGPVPVDG